MLNDKCFVINIYFLSHLREIRCGAGVVSVKTNAVYVFIVLFLPFKKISLYSNKIVPDIAREVNS